GRGGDAAGQQAGETLEHGRLREIRIHGPDGADREDREDNDGGEGADVGDEDGPDRRSLSQAPTRLGPRVAAARDATRSPARRRGPAGAPSPRRTAARRSGARAAVRPPRGRTAGRGPAARAR